jgi:hypothetical protein
LLLLSAIMRTPRDRSARRRAQRKTGLVGEPADVLASRRRPWWSTPLLFEWLRMGGLG